MQMTWVILTGEYPPQAGGVADYSQQVAEALFAGGDVVHVFAPGPKDRPAEIPKRAERGSIYLHALNTNFERIDRRMIENRIQSMPEPRRILVQYVPHAFGKRAMNVGFARWVRSIGQRGIKVDVMFHEVAYPLEHGQPLKHRLLAHVNRRMARWTAEKAERIFVSIPAWETLLREIGVSKPMRWLPIPANIAATTEPHQVAEIRRRFSGSLIVGHFGTYGSMIVALLEPTIVTLAAKNPSYQFLLLGRGSDGFAASLRKAHPEFSDRVHATGGLDAAAVADHLAACDVALQPYPEGVSCRRGSVMASLILGVPVVTCSGPITEPIWSTSGAVVLAKEVTVGALAEALQCAVASRDELTAIGVKGRALYAELFSLQHTIDALKSE